jgi:4-hydroxy-tetrahydrodipicolinate reductase
MTPIRVLLIGAKGRMGNAVAAAAKDARVVIAAALDQGDDFSKHANSCDAIIDFSHASATAEICRTGLGTGKPLVIGTTGQSLIDRALIKKASKSIPIVLSPNFSVGVNALFWLTRKTAQMLGDGFDLEITEVHHRLKKDAPSGTAKKLAEILCEVRKLDYPKDIIHGRKGMVGERKPTEVAVHSIRGGDVIGDHTVIFAGEGERLELSHKASSRDAFAIGALRAARWIIGRPPGLYSMEDVIGL